MDRNRFKQVWLPLSDSFYRVAFTILGSGDDAKDAVQDLYIKLWNMRDSLDNVRNPLHYGVRTVRNICIDRLRRGRRIPNDDVSLAEDTSSEVPAADRSLAGREMLEQLEKAMDSLPQAQRTVVEMKFFRQLEYDEISAMTGMSPINVRVLVSRARKAILSAMKDYMNF